MWGAEDYWGSSGEIIVLVFSGAQRLTLPLAPCTDLLSPLAIPGPLGTVIFMPGGLLAMSEVPGIREIILSIHRLGQWTPLSRF